MKNITPFYCKQTPVLLNTKRKGYKITQSLLPTAAATTSLCSPRPRSRRGRCVGCLWVLVRQRMLQPRLLGCVGGFCVPSQCQPLVFTYKLG